MIPAVNEIHLLKRLHQGDDLAFEAIYEKYSRPIVAKKRCLLLNNI